MGKYETIKGPPSSSGEAAILAAPVSDTDASVTPRMALAGTDLPKVETPPPEMRAQPRTPEQLAFDIPRIETAKIELASIEAPHIAPEIDEELRTSSEETATKAEADDVEPPAKNVVPHISRFTMLAASLALAAALGGMLGALTAYGLARPGAIPAAATGRTGLDEMRALKENVVQARVELAALKVGIESANRSAGAQFTRIGELVERLERTQAEPVAKLNKAIEALDRLSRADAAAQTREATGSIAPTSGAGGKPGIVEGWVVRDVQRGTALIEGRMGLVEVDQGDVVPGLGRVDAIRKQDGRWVVVTSKGLITTSGR
jgi:hypothetical protein